MRLLGEHELTGPRQRIESALRERLELELSVAIGEVREHVERQPVANRLVERRQDARLIGIAGVTLQEQLRLLTAVAAEVGVEQIDHGPEVTALLDVHLKEIAEVVQRRRRGTE